MTHRATDGEVMFQVKRVENTARMILTDMKYAVSVTIDIPVNGEIMESDDPYRHRLLQRVLSDEGAKVFARLMLKMVTDE